MTSAELRALLAKATPRPWGLDHQDTYVSGPTIDGDWDWITGEMGRGSDSDESLRGPHEWVQANCRALVAVMNRADLLLELWEQVESASAFWFVEGEKTTQEQADAIRDVLAKLAAKG